MNGWAFIKRASHVTATQLSVGLNKRKRKQEGNSNTINNKKCFKKKIPSNGTLIYVTFVMLNLIVFKI